MQSERKPITKESASDKLAEAMNAAIKRLETIQETHAEICLGDDLAHYRTALALYRRIPSFAQREAAWNTRPTASNLPADSNLQKTQIAPDVVEEVREALANLISVAERNIYPQPDKVNSDYTKLVSAKSALAKLSAMPSGLSAMTELDEEIEAKNPGWMNPPEGEE